MNLGIIDQGPSDWTSFFRSSGVWGYVSREYGVNLIRPSDGGWGWQNILQCDAMFIHRPWSSAHAAVAAFCHTLKVPVWADYDDNLFCVERSNRDYEQLMAPASQRNIRSVAELASLATVTTEALAKVYRGAVVVPNALNDYLWSLTEPALKKPSVGPKKVISWRGGCSHYADMEPFLPAIQNVATDFPDWDWHFFGCPHWTVGEAIPGDQLHRHPFVNVFSYMRDFADVHPSVHIVPLLPNTFNLGKSNLSWIEASYAGAVTLAPDSPEWHRPGILNYADAESFERELRTALKTETNPIDVQISRNFIAEHLLLSNVNRQRFELLRNLCASSEAFNVT